jgi:hypothetical protein
MGTLVVVVLGFALSLVLGAVFIEAGAQEIEASQEARAQQLARRRLRRRCRPSVILADKAWWDRWLPELNELMGRGHLSDPDDRRSGAPLMTVAARGPHGIPLLPCPGRWPRGRPGPASPPKASSDLVC